MRSQCNQRFLCSCSFYWPLSHPWVAGRSHTLQAGLGECQGARTAGIKPCPFREGMWQQKVCGCLEATEHFWAVLPPWIHQPHLACLSSLDTSWSNPQAVRKGIRFVSSDEKCNLLGQLDVCANGLQLQSCDMSDLTTHTPHVWTNAPTSGTWNNKISPEIYFTKMSIPTWEHPLKFLWRVGPNSFS